MIHYFIAGGTIMWPILFLLILGIIIAIVKFWLLFSAKIDTKKFLQRILELVKAGKSSEAIALCEKTRGPVSALFHAGLLRIEKGRQYVESSMENEAVIQMGILEKGMIWLSTIIAVAPMLGFLGTVQGMIVAFDQIAKSNDIVPSEVASGISIALLTTFFGLSVAIPMQILYNWFVAIIDSMVVNMEDAANLLIENLIDAGILKEAKE